MKVLEELIEELKDTTKSIFKLFELPHSYL